MKIKKNKDRGPLWDISWWPSLMFGGVFLFIYPENLKAKPMLWLWELRDIGIIGISFLLSVLALSQGLECCRW